MASPRSSKLSLKRKVRLPAWLFPRRGIRELRTEVFFPAPAHRISTCYPQAPLREIFEKLFTGLHEFHSAKLSLSKLELVSWHYSVPALPHDVLRLATTNEAKKSSPQRRMI